MNGLCHKLINLSPTAKIAVSLVLKDAVGCYLYVNQARSNRKMTPEQRSDVANYDLANGFINIGLQLLAVRPIEYIMDKFVSSKLMKHFFKDLDTRLKTPDNKALLKLLKHKEGLTKGAVALLSVIACQYLIKRFVSPFLSVPAGEKSRQLGLIKAKLYPEDEFITTNNPSDISDNSNFKGEETNLIKIYDNILKSKQKQS